MPFAARAGSNPALIPLREGTTPRICRVSSFWCLFSQGTIWGGKAPAWPGCRVPWVPVTPQNLWLLSLLRQV